MFFPSILNLQETIGFSVYTSSGYTAENNFNISEENILMTIQKKRHNETNTSHLTQLEKRAILRFLRIPFLQNDCPWRQKNVQPLRNAF